MLKTPLLALILLTCLTACSNKDAVVTTNTVPDLAAIKANLAFTCAYEKDHLPVLNPEADALFKYARSLEKRDGPKEFAEVGRLYRIAAAHDHYKANGNLQNLISQGLVDSPSAENETLDLAEQLVKQGIPGGYYDIGHYLDLGYGVAQDKDKALRYFRKAADLGNPEAQYYVADKLAPIDIAPDIARQMRQCASEQGHAQAANMLGVNLSGDKHFPEAVKAFQKGAEAGDTSSAGWLEEAFKAPPPTEELYYLALPNDPERSRRYKLIVKFLNENDGRNPKVPDIDKIVPLPPTKLPHWDGHFQWKKEQAAATPPEKPSEDLIKRLSKAKGLDPKTGLPLPVKTAATKATAKVATMPTRLPLGSAASSGVACPQSGLWCADIPTGKVADAKQQFSKGDPLPELTLYQPRAFTWMETAMGVRQERAKVTWRLVSYSDEQQA